MDAKLIAIIGAALAVSIGSIGPALAEGRPLPRPWMQSPASPKRQAPSRAPCSWGWR